jgi:hypothetical protein
MPDDFVLLGNEDGKRFDRDLRKRFGRTADEIMADLIEDGMADPEEIADHEEQMSPEALATDRARRRYAGAYLRRIRRRKTEPH